MRISVAPSYQSDPRVFDYAQAALMALQHCGFSSSDIRKHFLSDPEPEADAMFESSQIVDEGRVVAPASAVRAAMHLLLLN